MELSTRTRRMLSTVLAVVLAVESVSAVAAAAVAGPAGNPLRADAPAGVVPAAEAVVAPAADLAVVATAPASAPRIVEPAPRPSPSPATGAATTTRTRIDHAAPATTRGPLVARAKASATPAPSTSSARASSAGSRSKAHSYSGTNHVWIPGLGISRSVRSFACSRTRPPDNYMYRWGCAGANNVYLMGHASGVMRGLHDAYVRGRLHAGMRAWYADGRGRVHAYVVRWWRVTRPTTDASWAWAAQSRPSMTLQTCVGSRSQYRLMVRLVEVGG